MAISAISVPAGISYLQGIASGYAGISRGAGIAVRTPSVQAPQFMAQQAASSDQKVNL